MEIYNVQGLAHAAGMVMAYLPKEKIVVEADMFTPPAPNAPLPTTLTAANRTFYNNVQRLKLDVSTIAPIHGGRVFPWADFLFTANGDAGDRSSSDTVSIIEGSGPLDWKVTVLPVRNGPEAIEISPDGKEVWTATRTDGGVSVIDIATNKVTRTLSVQTKGSNRLKFTPDGKLVLISDNPGGELVVLDAVAGKVIKRLKIGRTTTGIQIVPDGSRAYVAAEADDNVAVI